MATNLTIPIVKHRIYRTAYERVIRDVKDLESPDVIMLNFWYMMKISNDDNDVGGIVLQQWRQHNIYYSIPTKLSKELYFVQDDSDIYTAFYGRKNICWW